MIAFLKGNLMFINSNNVVVMVGGVGYKIFVTANLNIKLGVHLGSEVELYIYQQIKENILDLYGFSTQDEKDMFEALISVSGVGPKMGISILNTASVSILKQAIAEQNSGILTKVSGLGIKKAQKIIIELKDKYIGFIGSSNLGQVEVLEALESMGYARSKIQQVLRNLPQKDISIEDLIKTAIQEMGRDRI